MRTSGTVACAIAAGVLVLAAKTAEPPGSPTTLANGVKHYVADRTSSAPRFFSTYAQITGLQLPGTQELPFGRSVAMLVGVGKYTYIRPALKGVAGDLDGMRAYLLGRGGFDDVYVAQDGAATAEVTSRYMLNIFPRELNREDRLLFYFSGHGADGPGGGGYMLFAGAKAGDFSREVLPVTAIQEWSKGIPASHILFILDSCSSGLGITQKLVTDRRDDRSLLATLSRNGSRALITAGTAEESTYDVSLPRGGSYSVFTRCLLDSLESPEKAGPFGSLVELNELFAETYAKVKRWSDETKNSLTPDMERLERERYRGTFIFLNPNLSDPVGTDIKQALRITDGAVQPGPGVQGDDLTVAVGKTEAKGSELILSGGMIPADKPQTYALVVSNHGNGEAQLGIRTQGAHLEATWDGLRLTTAIPPGGSHGIIVTVPGTTLSLEDRLLIVSGDRTLITLTFDIVPRPATITVTRDSGLVLSGVGSEWGAPAFLCLGPAPAGYGLAPETAQFWLTGDRVCGSWSTCEWQNKDDTNVCFKFSLQGHSESLSVLGVQLPGPGAARVSQGHLRASYNLTSVVPELKVLRP